MTEIENCDKNGSKSIKLIDDNGKKLKEYLLIRTD